MRVALGPGRFHHPVDRALDGVVAPPGQQVSRVDDNGVLDRGGIDKLPVGRLHLQAAARVLEQEGDGPVVAVLARAHLTGVDLEHLALDGRVVQQSERVVADVQIGIEKVGFQPHADGDGPHHLEVQRLALVEEVGHGALEADHGATGGFGGPLVRVPLLIVAADLEGLLDVGGAGADLLDLADVGQLGYLFAAGRGVATVGLGGGPAVRELGVEVEVEELGAGAKDVLARFRGDGVVLEVDEAGRLEAVEDGLGCFDLFGFGSGEELGEVDELLLVVVVLVSWFRCEVGSCLFDFQIHGSLTGIKSPSDCTAAFSIVKVVWLGLGVSLLVSRQRLQRAQVRKEKKKKRKHTRSEAQDISRHSHPTKTEPHAVTIVLH